MCVLYKINPTVQRAVANASLPMKAIRSRTRPWRRQNNNRDGDAAEYETLLEFDTQEIATKELIINGEPMFYSIMRGALQVRALLCDL